MIVGSYAAPIGNVFDLILGSGSQACCLYSGGFSRCLFESAASLFESSGSLLESPPRGCRQLHNFGPKFLFFLICECVFLQV